VPAMRRAVREAVEQIRRADAEAALARERALLRTLIDQIPDLIYVKDAASRFLLANEAVARLMGAREPAQLLGRTDVDFHSAELAAEYRADEVRVLAGTPIFDKEEPANHSDGTRHTYLTSKLPLRDSAGCITRLIGIGRDITARKAAEDARRRSDEK